MSAAFNSTSKLDRNWLPRGSRTLPAEDCRQRIIDLWSELCDRTKRGDRVGVLLSHQQLLTWGALYRRARLQEGNQA